MKKNIRTILIVVFVILVLVFLYSAYRVTHTVHQYNESARYYDRTRKDAVKFDDSQMTDRDPGATPEPNHLRVTSPINVDFDALINTNADIKAWLYSPDTKIDYPVLQGENNLSYINKDVYGRFALAGSIFLDCRNQKDFSDPYNLLYGHHMSESHMFGDLDLYEKETFFRKNTTGTLLLPGKVYDLKVLAFIRVTASEEEIFNLDVFRNDSAGVARFTQQKAQLKNEELETIGPDDQLLALSTCSSDFTDARVIVLTKMIPRQKPAK